MTSRERIKAASFKWNYPIFAAAIRELGDE
jgi:hypothetical protein